MVKEEHRSPLRVVEANRAGAGCGHLVAAVGGDCATVLDNRALGTSRGVVAQFRNEGRALSACAWVSADGVSAHPHGDAYLALASGACLQVVSLVAAAVVARAAPDARPLLDLAATAGRPGVVAALSEGGALRLWGVADEALELLAEAAAGPESTALAWAAPDRLLVGDRAGRLTAWEVRAGPGGRPEAVERAGGPPLRPTGRASVDARVAQLEAAGDGTVVCRHPDGLMVALTAAGEVRSRWKVPGAAGPGFRFGLSEDGAHACCGSADGAARIFSCATGKALVAVKPYRLVGEAAACCQLLNGCSQLLTAQGEGFLFRYERAPPAAAGGAGD